MGTPSLDANGIDLNDVSEVSEREGRGRVIHIQGKNLEPAYYTTEAGERRPVTVLIAGSYSPQYRKILDDQTQRILKRKQTAVTNEMISRNRLELVAGCILEWEGFVIGGKPAPLTIAVAMQLLAKAEWIRAQLEDAQNDHEAFFETASEN